KKIFLSKQIAMNLFKSIFKVIAIGLVAYLIIADNFDIILQTPDVSVALALKTVAIAALKIIIWSTVLLLVLAIPDYFFQKREFIESLKMTKEEIKEELKETMGDPYIRARLREMQREIVMRNMITEVPKADVVVTNPTHYAVALKYEKKSMEAPTVIAKGVDSMALRIREVARENAVPMIENRPLAQEMYKRLDVGDIIPEDLFYAVSLVYAELYRKHQYREAI
ncbi:MAG TPA: EscU/YscU/HrcU family type III secretion system export apparatus switch protein, partial [Spirochaetota bacterium]|nr:EscU/YscU/HrcU family type III secretion system export apparatus switch protein [Spirochaetota bacterium]